MTTPAKNAPAKTTTKTAPVKATTKPAFSFAGLSFDDAPAPVRGSGRVAEPLPENVVKVIAASWAERAQIPNRPGRFRGAGKAVTVPTDQVSTVSNLLRRAAREINQGLGLRTDENKDGTTTIRFAVQSAKERKPKGEGTPATK